MWTWGSSEDTFPLAGLEQNMCPLQSTGETLTSTGFKCQILTRGSTGTGEGKLVAMATESIKLKSFQPKSS